MRRIRKLFENFNKFDLEKELKKYSIENYTINDDGTIDVDGDVDIANSLWKIPFRFGKVFGDFHCHTNKLTSLEGSPYEVVGSFYCSSNNLTSLNGSPQVVGRHFACHFNNLTNLKGSPQEVGGNFICHDNNLYSLEIGGVFSCINNPNLKELYSLSNIEGDIYCDKHVDISKFEGYCKKIIQK